MITIGIDPGIERIGIGVVQKNDSKLKIMHSQLIKTSASLNTSKRLLEIDNQLKEIISHFKIDNAAIEELFFAKNVKTAMNVAQARGVILCRLAKSGIDCHEYTPLEVKQAISGYGRADKQMMQRVLTMILGNDAALCQDDVADGIAIAITHLNHSSFYAKLRK